VLDKKPELFITLIKEELELDDPESSIKNLWSNTFRGNIFKMRSFHNFHVAWTQIKTMRG
jgi:hypothetical protein